MPSPRSSAPIPPRQKSSSSRRHAARPMIWSARSRRTVRRDLRADALRIHGAGGPPGGDESGRGAACVPVTQAGAEAAATRAVFDAVVAGELDYFGPVAKLPGFPEGARADAARASAGGHRRRRISRLDAPGRRRPRETARSRRGAVRQVGGHRPRDAVQHRGGACGAHGSARRAGSDCRVVFLDVPLDSRAEADFARAIIEQVGERAGDRAGR